jgi:folate-binding protein YgfZ
MTTDSSVSPHAGTWVCERDDVAACLAQPVVATIDELGVIAVEGADAAAFLHAQLTNDVASLDTRRLQLNGYCSAKGRLYAVFNNWRDTEAIYLQLPREILPAVMKRLSMFVLRAKARLRDASSEWTSMVVIGPGSASALTGITAELPDAGSSAPLADDGRVARLPASPQVGERFMLLARAPVSTELIKSLAALRNVPSGVFWWSQIDAAIPSVFAATQEKFVPQMINLEVLGGVNFRKGCYPGQEVVARSQYLGKLRRRMQIGHTDAVACAGADVFAAHDEAPIGTIVMAASAPQGGMDVLFECPAERAVGALHLDSSSGPALTPRPLPYALVDVTA